MWKGLVAGFVVGAVVSFLQPVVGIIVFGLVVLAGLVLPPGPTFTSVPGRLGLASSMLAAAAIGLIAAKLALGVIGPRTPAPPSAVSKGLMVDSARLGELSREVRAAAIAYADSLTYADSTDRHGPPDRYHGQWDRNLLDTLGTIGLIEPEEHIHRTWKRDLAWGRGRVQLKITIVPTPNHPGTIVNLSGIQLYPGVTYVWVDSLVMVSRDSGTARALYIPTDPNLPVQRHLVRVLRGYRWNQAVARWSPGECWDCGIPYWCESSMLRR